MKRRRLRWGVGVAAGVVLGLPLVAALVVAGSVWSEASFPSDAEDSSAVARARGVVTRPIVKAVGRFARDRVRSHFEKRMLMTGLSLEETIARFRDETLEPSERAVYAYRLARVGSPEAVAALLEVFKTAPPEHKAFLAQLLGSTGDPAVGPWLRPLVDDPDEKVVTAAIRGLSALDGYEATGLLEHILGDGERSEAVRVEAALGLGTVGTESARDALMRSFDTLPRNDVATEVLSSLGMFPFDEVSDTFESVLAEPETPAEIRIAAVEALYQSSNDAVPFLLGVAKDDGDPEVRASAAWAISAHDGGRGVAPALAGMTEQEPDTFVRRRLYEALLRQPKIPAERLLPRIRTERHIATRVAALNAVGRAVGGNPQGAVATEFDDSMVPELERIATSRNSLNIRMRAVFALRRARTPASQDALAVIAETPCPQVAAAARHGLPTTR